MIEYFNRFLQEKMTYCEKVTVEYYRMDVGYFMDYCRDNEIIDVMDIDKSVLSNYILYLRGTGITNVSIHTYYRALKVFVRWLYDNGYIEVDCTLKIKLPKSDKKLVLPLTNREVQQINDCFFQNENGLRNYCIFHLMIDCGLRSSEVVNINFKDVNDNKIYIRRTKNNKSRIVLLPAFLYDSIQNYYRSVPDKRICLFYDRWNKSVYQRTLLKRFLQGLKRFQELKG